MLASASCLGKERHTKALARKREGGLRIKCPRSFVVRLEGAKGGVRVQFARARGSTWSLHLTICPSCLTRPFPKEPKEGLGRERGVQARLSHCAVENRQWVATAAPLGQAAGRPGASCALFGMPCGRFDTGVYQGVGVMRQVACCSGCLLCSGLHSKTAGGSHRRQRTEEVKRSAMVVVGRFLARFPSLPVTSQQTQSLR